ncbi:MAG: nucleoside deaminase [Rhodospirillales bacterium]|nr:nucleoside deaminase [Alphaproteobacteria bacterium]USO04657.1 MAG: nucleoside deaminase [Rhodospirillales bacterium]
MKRAYRLALESYREGGCPIGALLVDDSGRILGEGHNMLVQEGNPILHGEMAAMRAAGRHESRRDTTMYTTLSPCMMCAGTIVQFKIPRVVVGDAVNSAGNIEFLRERGVEVTVLEDPDCIALVKKFREEKPDLWLEDWGGA